MNDDITIYEVGGSLRDELLGKSNVDKDLVAVTSSFENLRQYIRSTAQKVFLEKPEFGIIRYLDSDDSPCDISLAVKKRDDKGHILELGSIENDLCLRDFTINAMARKIETGEVFDPFNGKKDIETKTIKTVRSIEETFMADPVRIIRALRFKIQLGFEFAHDLSQFLYTNGDFSTLKNINRERIRQELDKALAISTHQMLNEIYKMSSSFRDIIFSYFKVRFTCK
ncbi:MAG: hypothetical protein ACOCUH_02760 [Bacteriovoracia bacterium]